MTEVKNKAVIQKISEETGLTGYEISEMIKGKKAELKGLLSDEGALFLIAKELGVELSGKEKVPPENESAPENDAPTQANDSIPWWEKAKAMAVASGNYIAIANGFTYLFKFTDIEAERQYQEVEKKDLQGNPTLKYWFFVQLIGVQVKQDYVPIVQALQIQNEKKYDKVMALKQNLQQEYTLELPKTAAKALGEFISTNGLKNNELFSMERTGTSGSTKYIFKKFGG